jgi:hypothetical protein
MVGCMASALLLMPVAVAEEKTPGFNNLIPETILTPDRVETRIGTLEFFDGMPDTETVRKVYDNLDFLRGVEVFLNFIPATSIEGLRLGMVELGATRSNQCVIWARSTMPSSASSPTWASRARTRARAAST